MRALALAVAIAATLATGCQRVEPFGLVGTVERDRIELKVESAEPILERLVRDGDKVAAGDLLIQQDPARFQLRLEQARGQRDQAAGRLAELVRGPRAEAIRETRARLEAAKAQTVNSRAELDRVQNVFNRGLASANLRDETEARWKSAAAEEEAIHETLRAQLTGTTPEELEQAEAALATAEAVLAQAQLDVDRTGLRAPVNGTVDRLLYQVGERPPAGTTVAILLDDARVYARIYVPEAQRTQVIPGRELQVRVDGAERPLQGTVRWVSADASFTPYFALTEHDRSRLSYLAELDLPDASGLPSGLPLVVELPPQD